MMLYLQFFTLIGLLVRAGLAQQPVENFQRWLMIIKPYAQAGGPWVGTLTQEDIDRTTEAFTHTLPQTVSEITDGRVMIEAQVVVSDEPLTSVSDLYYGMVMPEDVPNDVSNFVSPDQWDGVAIYSAFTEHAYWGTSEGAGVGWFSVNHRTDLGPHDDAIAGWIHEMLHASSWYFADQRLGPVAPACAESPDGRDGTHCGPAWGYRRDSGNLPNFLGWYRDTLNGVVNGNLGLGSKAWALGSRRETYLGLAPGSSIPAGVARRSAPSDVDARRSTTSRDNSGMDAGIWR